MRIYKLRTIFYKNSYYFHHECCGRLKIKICLYFALVKLSVYLVILCGSITYI